MAGTLRTMKLLMAAVILAACGLVYWRRRDTARQTWISIGGLDDLVGAAGYLVGAEHLN